MTFELLSLAGFTLSAAGLAAAFEERSPRLDKTRWWCLALTGSLLWIGLVGDVAAWTVVVSCVGFLISLVAVALAGFADRGPADGGSSEREPVWWPEFERDFRRYAGARSERGRTG